MVIAIGGVEQNSKRLPKPAQEIDYGVDHYWCASAHLHLWQHVSASCGTCTCALPCCCLTLSIELKRDPGIPNLYPFKEQLLQQIEERRQQVG